MPRYRPHPIAVTLWVIAAAAWAALAPSLF